MKVSTSAFYSWQERPAKVISVEELQLYRRCKELFKQSRESLGSRVSVATSVGILHIQ
ncbi:hypothetical protein [Piscirickettsia salmonis]|uniref:hypothetical protein n=1 Tax=Piscirickettsia salmonis TaxID=1238 RepID=UPI0012BAF129|nr:hypothetical protein [Piscirickettsia salmonis]